MSNAKAESQEMRQSGLAPETHNDEQDDHRNQAQEVSEEAQHQTRETGSPTESVKDDNKRADERLTQDTVDHIRTWKLGRVDIGAYRGEPNHDDNVDKYGKSAMADGLRGDGLIREVAVVEDPQSRGEDYRTGGNRIGENAKVRSGYRFELVRVELVHRVASAPLCSDRQPSTRQDEHGGDGLGQPWRIEGAEHRLEPQTDPDCGKSGGIQPRMSVRAP